MLTPAQLRAALEMLKWTLDDLASASKIHRNTCNNFAYAAKPSNPKRSTLRAWRRALEQAGIIFIDPTSEHGPGVMLRDPKAE